MRTHIRYIETLELELSRTRRLAGTRGDEDHLHPRDQTQWQYERVQTENEKVARPGLIVICSWSNSATLALQYNLQNVYLPEGRRDDGMILGRVTELGAESGTVAIDEVVGLGVGVGGGADAAHEEGPVRRRLGGDSVGA